MREQPNGELHAAFSSPDAAPTPWDAVEEVLETAEIFWITTVRPDARPHVTPLIAAWIDDSVYFGTGPNERKERNLRSNRRCVLTTGCNAFRAGLDVVVEGSAERVHDDAELGRVAARFERKYGWRFAVRGDTLQEVAGPDPAAESSGASALVFRVAPVTVFAYGRGDTFSATRWRF